MIQLNSVVQYLDSLLQNSLFPDSALNGLQVESQGQVLKKVAFAVDTGLSVIKEAVKSDADLLITHHGLFWNEVQALRGVFGEKINLLLQKNCSLYASHLPLDANREVGNNFEIGRFLELDKLEDFFEIDQTSIGARGACSKALPFSYFSEKVSEMKGVAEPIELKFGPEKIKKVGIVSGAGHDAIAQCAADKLDLLITGEARHCAYHLAKELKVNVIFAGHYATEVFGVSALQKRLEKDFDIETIFINEETGI